MKNKNWQKVLVVSLILSVFFAFKFFSLENFFDISFLKENRENILAIYQKSPIGFTIVYFITYILTTAFFIPVATGLSLIAGAILGTLKGTVLVSIASTIGATISFILARYLLRDFFQVKYSKQFEQINRGVSEEGAFYLFSLRLVPIFPFFVINILMGLTQMKLLTYFWVSQLAMLPATIIYINAGEQIGNINSLADIVTPKILFSLVLIGVLPLSAKKVLKFLRSKKA